MKILTLFILLAQGSALAEQQPLRIGLVRKPTAAPLYVAIAAGAFAQAGLEPRLQTFASDEAVARAVASGTVDIGFASLTPKVYSTASSGGLKMIGSQVLDQAGFPLEAFVGPVRLTAASDLAGKRLGMGDDESGARYALHRIAERFHLDEAALHPVWLKTEAKELRALSGKKADAVLLPYAAALRARRPGDSLLRLSDLVQWQESAIFARIGDGNRGLLRRFLTAYRLGAAEYNSNFLQYDDGGDFIPGPRHEQYLAFIVREAKISPQMFDATKPYSDPRAGLDVADIRRQVAFWQARGKLDSRIAATDLVDTTLAP
jgi:ABC-type nitrate/sulfonate/bicarbonate transport system substrate-binding protein